MGDAAGSQDMNSRLPELGPDERDLILNCARLKLDGPLLDQTEEILRRPLAWNAILPMSELHSVAPLLHRHLKRFYDSDLIPAEARRTLFKISHRVSYRNRQFSRAFQELHQVFAEAGIPILVLKGLSLVELIYGNLSLRPLIDLNLLIPREQLETAKNVLSRMGYTVPTRYAAQRLSRWLTSALHLVKPGDFKIQLLLQWDLIDRPRVHAIDLRSFWDEAKPALISERDALIPSPVDLVLYLCLQPGKQGYLNSCAVHLEDPAGFVFTEWTDNRLIRYTDIHEAIRHYQGTIRWETLVERAKAGGIEESVYASLHWVTRLFGPTVEPWVLQALRPPSPRRLRRWLFEVLAQEEADRTSGMAVKAVFRAWWLRRRKASQLRLVRLLDLFEFIFPRPDEIRLHYRLHSRKVASVYYAFHISKSLFLCTLGVPLWTYHLLTKRRPSPALRRETPFQGASRL